MHAAVMVQRILWSGPLPRRFPPAKGYAVSRPFSPRLRPLPNLHDRGDSLPPEIAFTGAGLSPAGSTSLYSRHTWTSTGEWMKGSFASKITKVASSGNKCNPCPLTKVLPMFLTVHASTPAELCSLPQVRRVAPPAAVRVLRGMRSEQSLYARRPLCSCSVPSPNPLTTRPG